MIKRAHQQLEGRGGLGAQEGEQEALGDVLGRGPLAAGLHVSQLSLGFQETNYLYSNQAAGSCRTLYIQYMPGTLWTSRI